MPSSPWSPSDINLRSEIHTHRRLFEGSHEAVFVRGTERITKKYVSINLLAMASRKWAELTVPEMPVLTAGVPEQQAAIDRLIPVLRLPQILQQSPLVVSYAGQCAWKLTWDDVTGTPALSLWGNNGGEYVTYEMSSPYSRHAVAANCWYVVRVSDRESYCIRERAALTPQGLEITNTAYKWDGTKPLNPPLPLSVIPWSTLGLPIPVESVVIPGVTTLPVIPLDNLDLDGDGEADSDYTTDLVVIQEVLNRVATIQFSVIELTENPIITVTEDVLPGDDVAAEVVRDEFRFSVLPEGSDPQKKLKVNITQFTGNLENSTVYREWLINQFHDLCGLPQILFGKGLSGSDSGYARRLALESVVKPVSQRRERYTPALTQTLRCAMELERAYGTSSVAPIDTLAVEFLPVVPADVEPTE